MNEPTITPSDLEGAPVDQLTPEHAHSVLQYFRERPGEAATVEELGEFICERKQLDVDESRVAIRIHHSTLPKLAEMGFLDYDQRSNTARSHGYPLHDD